MAQRDWRLCVLALNPRRAADTRHHQNKLKLAELRETYGVVDTWLREAMDGLEAQICAFLDTAFTQVHAL